MLKAKISQTKSNLYAVKTTKYDTTDIELIVETTDSSPWLNPKFELLGIKSDGHEVRQTENFKVIDLNNHIVQVTLDEQLVTCEGNVDLQLLIKDGSRKSSTPFKLHVGRSLDSDILESHRNVKVLDELEKYIIEGREYISEATGLAQSTANYVQVVNTQAEANEAQRLQNESQRQSAETKRKEAEDERKQAEVLRVQNEDTRQSAEVIRITNEQTRLENESNRIERETTRENKESIRQAQEQKRHSAESTRQSQEATRQSNEDNRKQAEKSRSQEETIRINNEATRKQAEDTRKSQELDRQSAESARRTAETNRVNAESTRTQNENTRKSQETTRQQKETERQSAETARQQNETSRQTAETKRAEAENARKAAETTRANDMQEFKDEASRLATELNTQSSRLDQLTEDTENQINEFVETNQTAVDSFLETADSRLVNDKDKIDYWGNHHQSLKDKSDYEVDKLLGDFNSINYQGEYITAQDTISRHIKNATMKGHTEVNCIQEPSGKDVVLPYSFKEGYDVTLTDTKETGSVQSTILKGCTLVNLVTTDTSNGYTLTNDGTTTKGKQLYMIDGFDNKIHTFILELSDVNIVNPNSAWVVYITTYTLEDKGADNTTIKSYIKNGKIAFNYKPSRQKKTVNKFSISLHVDSGVGSSITISNVVVLDGDYTNVDIPYFTGMQSVKMPVLKTVGKNLFNYSDLVAGEVIWNTSNNVNIFEDGWYREGTDGVGFGLRKCIKVKPNTRYYANFPLGMHVMQYKANGDLIKGIYPIISTGYVITSSETHYVNLFPAGGISSEWNEARRQEYQNCYISESEAMSSYEPYKSNILTVNEDVTLRGIGNVKDTLDCNTGELTQRIGEVVLDGSEDWVFGRGTTHTVNGMVYGFKIKIPNLYTPEWSATTTDTIVCDKLKVTSHFNQFTGEVYNSISQCSPTEIQIMIKAINNSSNDTLNELKRMLSENPVTVVYPVNDVIKTVDLSVVDQNENSVPALSTYNEVTYLSTSSAEGSLRPIASPQNPTYKVMLKPSTQYSIITSPVLNGHESSPIRFNLGGAEVETLVGNNCTLVTTPSTLANNKLEMSGRGQKLQGGVMVLEGNKTGMTFNHFDGMKSVENPTVRVNNANLFNINCYDWDAHSGGVHFTGPLGIHLLDGKNCVFTNPSKFPKITNLNPNSQYTVTFDTKKLDDGGYGAFGVLFVYSDGTKEHKSRVPEVPNVWHTSTATSRADKKLTAISIHNAANGNWGAYIDLDSFIITEGTEVNHIKGESNSLPLTIPMRSLPDGTCDTLNLLTGEYTRNIGYAQIDNELWQDTWQNNDVGYEDTIRFHIGKNDFYSRYDIPRTHSNSIYNTLFPSQTQALGSIWTAKKEAIAIHNGTAIQFFQVCMLKKNLAEPYLESFKQLLTDNPLCIQYPLATPVITYLDLQWEDGKLFAYDGTTHFFVDVEGGQLMPILDIDVPTNLSAATSRINREKNQLAQDNQGLQTTLELAKLKEAQLEKELAEAKEQVANEVTTLNKRDDLLEESQAVQDNDIVTSMLASAELFEMVLLMMPMSASMSKSMEVNPMVEVYVTLILKGEKTIEQVPAVIRDKVQAQLDLLTK